MIPFYRLGVLGFMYESFFSDNCIYRFDVLCITFFVKKRAHLSPPPPQGGDRCALSTEHGNSHIRVRDGNWPAASTTRHPGDRNTPRPTIRIPSTYRHVQGVLREGSTGSWAMGVLRSRIVVPLQPVSQLHAPCPLRQMTVRSCRKFSSL